MGRTVPTFRAALEDAIKKWDGYRNALRREDRELFDRMMDACRLHSSACGQAIRPVPWRRCSCLSFLNIRGGLRRWRPRSIES